jgi:K+-transporting ATPase ATPase C chain
MFREIKHGVLFTIVTMIMFGGAYHVAVWVVARMVFPDQAEGSLVRANNGTIVGSRLIAQRFARPEYFHSRPSAVDYNAASAGATNYGPSNGDHLKAVRQRLEVVSAEDHVTAPAVPAEMLTASGSGMDPHIPPSAADLQAPRVARARGVPVERVRDLIRRQTEPPTFGFLGRGRVDVLLLNLALDESLATGEAARK